MRLLIFIVLILELFNPSFSWQRYEKPIEIATPNKVSLISNIGK